MKFKSILAALLLAFVTSSFAFAKGKALVVYFSRADENVGVGTIEEGNTAVIAKIIAEKTGADVFEIVPVKPYPAGLAECKDYAKIEQTEKARPAYKGDIKTDGYDTIFLGYPVWFHDLPMLIYTFFSKHNLNGKTILPFCTHGGAGSCDTDKIIAKEIKKADVKLPLVIKGEIAQNKRSDTERQTVAWLKKNGF